MGLFNHLFKNKPPQGDERMDEGRQTPPSEGGNAPASAPDLTVFLHPKAYVPRGGAAPVHPGPRPSGQAGERPSERKTPQPAPPVAGEIVLTLGDVLSRIPTQLLKPGAHDARREMRFKIGDLSSDIARGRAVVPLSRIAALCPDIFRKEITPAEDMDVRLPLQKLVEQIGLMRSNPAVPLPGKVSRPTPTPSEAPPAMLPTRVPLAMRTPTPAPRSAPPHKSESKPGAAGAAPPNAFEVKPRAAAPPFTPPAISKTLQENILKAQPSPLRRVPPESRPGVSPTPEPAPPDAREGKALERPTEPAAPRSDKVIPFPAIAAKAETRPLKSDEENSESGAEGVLEEKLRQLLAQKAAGETASPPEQMAPLHLVTALAEIALQQSLLTTFETKDEGRKEAQEAPNSQQSALSTFEPETAQTAGVSLAHPSNFEALEESVVKSQLLSLLRMKLAGSGGWRAESGMVLAAAETAGRTPVLEAELRPMEGRALETSHEIAESPVTPEALVERISESTADAAVQLEAPGEVIAPKVGQIQEPDLRATDAIEEEREATAPLEPLKESVSKAEAIFAPQAEIGHSEVAPVEAKPENLGASASPPFAATLKDPRGQEPSNDVSDATVIAALPAEVLEETLKNKTPAALAAGIVSSTEPISPPKAEIGGTEFTLRETEVGNGPGTAIETTEAAPAELANLELPPEPVSKAGTFAALPAELPKAEAASTGAGPTKPEIGAAEVFEEPLKTMAPAALVKGMVSSVESISPHKAEIAGAEIALKETEFGNGLGTAIETAEAAPAELANLEFPTEPVSKAATSTALPAELPRPAETAPEGVGPRKPEIGAAEVLEEPLKNKTTGAPVKGIVSSMESVSPPIAEIARAEIALKETELGKGPAGAAEAAPAELANLESPSGPVSKSGASATLPAELPHAAESASEGAGSKKPEISAAKVLEDTLKIAAPAALVEGIVSNLESISPPKAEKVPSFPAEMPHTAATAPPPHSVDSADSEPTLSVGIGAPVEGSAVPELSDASASQPVTSLQAEIAHTEIAPQGEEPRRPEPGAVAAQEHTVDESVHPSSQSEPAAPLAVAPIDSNIAPLEPAPGAPEASAPALSAPDAPNERVEISAIPGANQSEPKQGLEPAMLAEAQIPNPAEALEAPFFDERATASPKDESISALLVSLTALTGSIPETSEDSALQTDEESPTHAADRIWLSLPAILKNCPKEILAGELPRMRESLGIELPLAQIEPQLASGAVEISSLRFIAALPSKYMQYFVVREDVKVSIPLEEILRNLPESERERMALSVKPPADADGEKIRAEMTEATPEVPGVLPIPPEPQAEEASAVVTAAPEALAPAAEVAEMAPHDSPASLEPAGVEVMETAPKSEHAEPKAADAALPEPPAPDASPEHASTPLEAVVESSPIEIPEAVAPSEETVAAVDSHTGEKPAEPPAEQTPEAEPGNQSFALKIPTFRVFAPPPIQVSASIVSAPTTPVPLAWAGHVSTQPPRNNAPRAQENEAFRFPAPPAESAPKRDAVAKPPPPDLEASRASAFAVPFEESAEAVAAIPGHPTPNADAADGLHFVSPTVPSRPAPVLNEGSGPPDSAEPDEETLDLPSEPDGAAESAPAAGTSALPVKNVEEADAPIATPETQKQEDPQSDSGQSTSLGEQTALIRPPMIRPMFIPAPRILGFAPAIDTQAAASPSERSSAVESSAPAGGEPPSIPRAFATASEGVPVPATPAESRGEAKRAETKSSAPEAIPTERGPDAPAAETGSTDGGVGSAKSRKGAPRIAGKKTDEKAPGPTPPKIALTIPKLPVLRVPPAPEAEAGIPAPESIPAPPPLPLSRFDQDVLQNLFMTDEFLDLPAVCRHVSTLPGIQACVISRRDENVHAGDFPDGFESSELLAFAPGVTQVAGRLPIGALKHFTLYAETHSVSFFERQGVCLCVVHRARSFIPGVREKLVTVADELSKS